MKQKLAISQLTLKWLCVTVFLIAGISGSAQQSHPEYAAVQSVIEKFFESINTKNGDLLASIEVGGAQILTVTEEVAGEYEFVERSWEGMTNFAGDSRLTERYWDEQLMISDVLAMFWASYDFHIDGVFSHCGIDVLNLIKVDGEWKIGHAMWTVQRPNCEDSPLGPLEQ